MVVRRIDPLRSDVPIVDKETGAPSKFFQRQWNTQIVNNGAVTNVEEKVEQLQTDVAALDTEVANIQAVDIVAGTGLSGGGNISGPGDVTLNLADTAVTAGAYGDATNVPQITIDAQGRITSAVNVPISGGGGGGKPWYFDPPTTSELATAVTAGTPTSTSATDDADVGFLMGATLSAADNMFGRVQTPPGANFTVTARVSVATGTGAGGIGNIIAGIMLRASGTGLRQVIGIVNFNQFGNRRATNTTFGAAAGVDVGIDPRHGVWIQVETNATQHIIRISDSGKVWIPWRTLSGADYVTGLNQVGLGLATSSTNPVATLTCDVWNVV